MLSAVLALSFSLVSPIQERLLFTLGRTTNANVVEYAARVAADGELDTSSPFDVHWKMLATDGHREGLNVFEGPAYGLSVQSVWPREEYVISIAALRERKLTVRRGASGFEADGVIGGAPARLRRIFVHAVEGGLEPRVTEVDLEGESVSDGHAVFERLVPR